MPGLSQDSIPVHVSLSMVTEYTRQIALRYHFHSFFFIEDIDNPPALAQRIFVIPMQVVGKNLHTFFLSQQLTKLFLRSLQIERAVFATPVALEGLLI